MKGEVLMRRDSALVGEINLYRIRSQRCLARRLRALRLPRQAARVAAAELWEIRCQMRLARAAE